MAFMISRETENVQSSSEVVEAFKALTSGDKPFITAQELYAVSIGLTNRGKSFTCSYDICIFPNRTHIHCIW